MKDFLNKAKSAAGGFITVSVDKATEVAKDNRPTLGDAKRAADFLVDKAEITASELSRLGKDALRTDLAKDAAAGAAIGAVLAVPVPLVGPIAGAVVGAGLGVYKSVRSGSNSRRTEVQQSRLQPQLEAPESPKKAGTDKFGELVKLHDLKVKGILTDEEFNSEKKKVLDR